MIWEELRRRERLSGKLALYRLSPKRATRACGWDECVATTFLLILACLPYYRELRVTRLRNYGQQGELFEDFCCESLLCNGWTTTRTGWASHQGAQKLKRTVDAVALALDEHTINAAIVQIFKDENEAGCDLVSHWPYEDRRLGRPVVLLQCASGADFDKKLATPDIKRWCDFIAFSTTPIRGFCTPYSFTQSDFEKYSRIVKGIFLDRFRLIQPFANATRAISANLERRLTQWSRARIKALPRLT